MLILVKVYLNRRYQEQFGDIYKQLHLNNDLLTLVEAASKALEHFPDLNEIPLDDFELWFYSGTIIKDKDKPLYERIFNELRSTNLTDTIVVEALTILKQRAIAGELALTAVSMADGTSSLEDIRRVYERFGDIQDSGTEDEFVTDDLEVLYENTVKSPGLRWRSKTLNQMLGSLRKGDFGFLFARPETGKTTFLASESTFFAAQTDRPILWFNNEEQGDKVKLRCYQAALGVEIHELMYDRAGNQARYLELTGGNLRIIDSATIHKREVERLCRKYEPALVIFDQIDKLKGFADDREDLRLGQIYIWARELAKLYCPIIGVCQAAGTGEGKKWLNMDDVTNAKTAKQAEADWILGIGKSHDVEMEYIRHFNICKNKLLGDEDTLPPLRHGKADIRIKPEISRYEDIV